MSYILEKARVIYKSKDGKGEKIFDALEWPREKAAGCKHSLAMCFHVPNKEEQMVRYYGHYSNVARDKPKRQDQDGLIPSDSEPVEDPAFSGKGSSEEFRKAGHV